MCLLKGDVMRNVERECVCKDTGLAYLSTYVYKLYAYSYICVTTGRSFKYFQFLSILNTVIKGIVIYRY